MQNLLTYHEIGRMFLISTVVMIGLVVPTAAVYLFFRPLIADNKAHIKNLMETLDKVGW